MGDDPVITCPMCDSVIGPGSDDQFCNPGMVKLLEEARARLAAVEAERDELQYQIDTICAERRARRPIDDKIDALAQKVLDVYEGEPTELGKLKAERDEFVRVLHSHGMTNDANYLNRALTDYDRLSAQVRRLREALSVTLMVIDSIGLNNYMALEEVDEDLRRALLDARTTMDRSREALAEREEK